MRILILDGDTLVDRFEIVDKHIFIIMEGGWIFYHDGNPDEAKLYRTTREELIQELDHLGKCHREILQKELGIQ